MNTIAYINIEKPVNVNSYEEETFFPRRKKKS